MERQTLVWIDLEMTGLDPQQDVILEIASLVTDDNLQIVKEGPNLVIHADTYQLAMMHRDVRSFHEKSKLIDAVRDSIITVDQAEQQTLAFLKEYAHPNSVLCGNSVWNDRNFLAHYMPKVLNYLHYRLIDVSSVKELIVRWYPNDPDVAFNKQENHRALEDIRESVAELKHYRRYFFV